MSTHATGTVEDQVADGYVEMPLAFFRSPIAPNIDLFCLAGNRNEPTLFASSELGVTDAQLLALEQRGYSKLYISKSDLHSVSSLLLGSLEDIVADDSFPAEERFSVLQSVIALEVEDAVRRTDCSQFVALSNRVGTQIADLVTEQSISPQKVFALAEHDTTTFVHSTNVAAYVVMLAQALGIDDQKQQQQLAVGAMLHDIGKRSIPQEVLTSPGKLTEQERAVIETHPSLGYEELHEEGESTFEQLMMAYQHHEWVDGSGYPAAVLGHEIHPWAKILAVVDVFDAITARRPYRVGMSVSKALGILEDGANKQFEPEAVRCWISLFHLRSR